MTFDAGDIINGYRILRLIGKGGMGAVYEVEHVNLGIRYALKAFVRDHGDVEAMRRRFKVEGKALARLRHPHLLRVYDLGEDEERGIVYFVMDCVADENGDVRTLADFKPGEVDEARLAKWYSQVRSALEYIHGKGIVHRDVKPANILIDANDNAILADLGISRFLSGELRRDLGAETTTDVLDANERKIIGSAMFLAPEVRNGEKATPASDAFSLGVTFYRMLTGIWYERGAVADGMMDVFGHEWRNALRRLLADEPAKRIPMPLIVPGACRLALGRRCLIIVACCLALAALIAAIWFVVHSRTAPIDNHQLSPTNHQAPSSAKPQTQSTTFDYFFPLHVNAQHPNQP